MMHELEDLVAKCVAAATQAQVTDLTVLAQLHSDLQSILGLAADPAVLVAARQAAALVEKLVLGHAQDPPETLRQIVELVNQIQSIIGTTSVNGFHAGTPTVAAEPAPEPDAEKAGCGRWFGWIGYFKSLRGRKTHRRRSS
jgi:hypothetical protein